MSTNDYTAPFEEFLRSLEELSREDEAAARRGNDDEGDRRREEAARRGELGEDWKKIQERIDNGETTLSDVFSGKDTSDAAAALRGTARRNITKAMQQARQQADDNDEDDPFAAIQSDLASLSEDIERRIRHLRGL